MDTVVSHLERHSHGVFLWVRLILDELHQMTTDAAIISCLTSLPANLSQIHDRTLRGINSLPSDQLELSKEIFRWTVFARRPLVVAELTFALKPRFGQLMNLKLEIKRCCGGLIVVDESDRVRLLHMTVGEHARQTFAFFFFGRSDVAHAAIARLCLGLIPLFENVSNTEPNFEENPLLLYSCLYWSQHLQASQTGDSQLFEAIRMLFTKPFVLAWIKIMFSSGKHLMLA